jgi:hypothetical protein
MRFSLELATQRVELPGEFVTAAAIAEITGAAAGAGFSAVSVTDHPAPDIKWLEHGGHHALDPFVALAFAAAADPEIRRPLRRLGAVPHRWLLTRLAYSRHRDGRRPRSRHRTHPRPRGRG